MLEFLSHLKEVAASPYAFVAYILVLAAWVYAIIARHRLTTIAQKIKEVPEKDRADILKKEYNVLPRNGLSAQQWIKARRDMLIFISFLALLIAVLLIVVIAITKSNGTQLTNTNTENINNKALESNTNSQTNINKNTNSQANATFITIDSIKNDQWIDVTKQKGKIHNAGHLPINGSVDTSELKSGKKIYVFVNDLGRGENDGWYLQENSITTSDNSWSIEDITLGDEKSPIKDGNKYQVIAVLESESLKNKFVNNHLTNDQIKNIPKEHKSEEIVVHIGKIIEK